MVSQPFVIPIIGRRHRERRKYVWDRHGHEDRPLIPRRWHPSDVFQGESSPGTRVQQIANPGKGQNLAALTPSQPSVGQDRYCDRSVLSGDCRSRDHAPAGWFNLSSPTAAFAWRFPSRSRASLVGSDRTSRPSSSRNAAAAGSPCVSNFDIYSEFIRKIQRKLRENRSATGTV